MLDILLMKVQPQLLAARSTAEKLKAGLSEIHRGEAAATTLVEIQNLATQFLAASAQTFEELGPLLGLLLGRNAPDRNYAELAKWAENSFGTDDPLCAVLTTANASFIRVLADMDAGFKRGAKLTVTIGASINETTWGLAGDQETQLGGYLDSFTVTIVPFVENMMMAILAHLTVHSPVTFEEIPEAERQKSAPVRFRAMTKSGEGTLVPAGKVTKEGNVVPELQRMLQQGRGKPIIASNFKGEWFVAAGSQIFHSPKWNNFHDFLLDYIKIILGGDWANIDLRKPREERHPLMVWYEEVTRFCNAYLLKGQNAPITSLVAAYLGLAYDLYLISHNNGKVHDLLISRLKQKDQFLGAYHEAAVTGMMIRAGFDIELEDESDSKCSHCEFTATHRATGLKYSVEAKMRQAHKRPEIRWLLGSALKKKANHPRLVFIEVNDEARPIESQGQLLLDLLKSVRDKEASLQIRGQPAPPAYLVVMNNPPATVNRPHMPAYMFEGFKIPDFRVEGAHASLREALNARQRHAPIEALLESLREFNHIPVTFDGQTKSFASVSSTGRLLLGRHYCIHTSNGDVTGELVHATVMAEQQLAFCVLRDNSRDQLVQVALTEQEMQSYHESPRTFFGREELEPHVKDALSLYDRIHERYKHNQKEALLKLLAEMGAKDLENLRGLTQEQLAKVFAERAAESIAFATGLVKPTTNAIQGL